MFTFGSNQNEPTKEGSSKPAAADWTQLIQQCDQRTEAPQKGGTSSLYDRCNVVVSKLQDDNAKDFVKALVFLSTRSNVSAAENQGCRRTGFSEGL